MKNLSLVFVILICTNFLFSQELPEVPLKNGMTFYEFNHKLDNQKKCIGNYFSFGTTEFVSMTTAISKYSNSKDSESTIRLVLIAPSKTKPNCVDTLICSNQSLTLVLKNPLKPYAIQGTIRLIFTSKNEYNLNILNLNFYNVGAQNKNELYGIGEIYLKIKERGKATKTEKRFFEELNTCAKRIDEIILKSVTETYHADDL
jgi:hypothetical protein